MDWFRVWPTRYCPQCGAPVVRANNPIEHDERLGLLVGTGEFPVWIGLICGVTVTAAVGRTAGFIAGSAVAAVLLVVWFAAILKLEARNLKCLCEHCTKVFRFEEALSRRGRHES
jgi:hypothetical protein